MIEERKNIQDEQIKINNALKEIMKYVENKDGYEKCLKEAQKIF